MRLCAGLACNEDGFTPSCTDASGATVDTSCGNDYTSGFPAPTPSQGSVGLFYVTGSATATACRTDSDCVGDGPGYGCITNGIDYQCVRAAPVTASCESASTSDACPPSN